MKTKKIRNLIMMLTVLVLLVGVLFILNLNKKEEHKEQEYTGKLLTSFHQSEINKVSYQYRGEQWLNYVYRNETWFNADDEEFPLSSSAFANNFVETFASVKTLSEIKDAGEIGQYGLDDPYLTIRVENLSGEEETYYLGDFNSMLQSYYLKKEGDDNIYTVGTDFLHICRQDVYDYAQVEAFPDYQKDTLKMLTMNNQGVLTEIAYFADGYETDLIGECKWFFGKPFSFYRSAETNKIEDFETDVLQVLQFSKLANYKPTAEDIERYGLNNSNRQYTIQDVVTDEESGKTSDRYQIVEFGNYEEVSDCYYARVTVIQGNVKEVSHNIYLADKAQVDSLLGLDPLSYIYTQVLYVKLVDIADENSDMTFQTPDGSFVLKNKTTFREDGTEKENIYYINDILAEESDVEGFYYDILANCGIQQVFYDRSKIVEGVEPTYTIIYNCNKTGEDGKKEFEDKYYGTQITVTYTVYDNSYYQVAINGQVDSLISKRIMDETMARLPEMIAEK